MALSAVIVASHEFTYAIQQTMQGWDHHTGS